MKSSVIARKWMILTIPYTLFDKSNFNTDCMSHLSLFAKGLNMTN